MRSVFVFCALAGVVMSTDLSVYTDLEGSAVVGNLRGNEMPTPGPAVTAQASTAQMAAYWVFAGWQCLAGLALIFEQAKAYGAGDMPQAKRVAELAGVAWLGFAYLTYEASMRIDTQDSMARQVMWTAVLFNAMFSVAAGPARLTPMNSREPYIVGTNTVVVVWVIISLVM